MYNKTYKKSKRDYKFDKRKKVQQYEDDLTYSKEGAGHPESEGKVDDAMSIKALRNQFRSSYSFAADPYDPALPTSTPYGILNGFNKIVGGRYGGLKNIDGGNVQQYPNSVTSKFLNYFDFSRIKFRTQYHYIPSQKEWIPDSKNPGKVKTKYDYVKDNYPGRELINQQLQAISEAVSQLQSTTFTQMEIYNYGVWTDMPMGDAETSETKTKTLEDGHTYKLYTNLVHVIYAISRYYQTFWLKLDGMLNWHNAFRLKMGTMIRSSYNRETPNLNALFGFFKKKSFISLIEGLNMTLPGEYIDREFALQIAKLTAMPSRRSNSITDPVLEIENSVQMPNYIQLIEVNPATDEFDDDSLVIFDSISDLTADIPGTSIKASYQQAIEQVYDLLSAEDTMKWARNSALLAGSENSRFNTVKGLLDVIKKCVTKFKTVINDYREVLDTTSRAGLVTWFKGYKPSVTRDTDAAIFRNLIIDDVYKMAMGGALDVKMDKATKRWRTFSMWNMYDGVPEYDTYSGGAFLTFSLKTITASDDADGLLNYIPQALVPVLESDGNHYCFAVNRKGSEVRMTPTAKTMRGDSTFDRLAPLQSQNLLQLRSINIPATYSDGAAIDISDVSTLIKFCEQVFGHCQYQTNTHIDPDTIAIYQIEIEDITNEMIRYARMYAPFKGTTDSIPQVGFLGTV